MYVRFSSLKRQKKRMFIYKSGNLGNEFHYLFNCTYCKTKRKKTIPLLNRENPNVLKFKELIVTDNIVLLTKLATFCKTIVLVLIGQTKQRLSTNGIRINTSQSSSRQLMVVHVHVCRTEIQCEIDNFYI